MKSINSFMIDDIAESDIFFVKNLISQYVEWINIDLSFQGIDHELDSFPGKYIKPDGAFLVAKVDNMVIGCVGLRKIDDNTCEMKRLYVNNEHKGKGIGKALVEKIIMKAKNMNYIKIRLDTLPKMKTAQELYKNFGFYGIEQYTENPIIGAKFMEKLLK